MKESKLVKHQVIKKSRVKGDKELIVSIRHDDECSNGHNTFAITATLRERRGDGRWVGVAWGCQHDEVARFFPELKPYLKWHLCSTDGPMHYIANTLYQAWDKDCWGLRKGEKRQIRNGRTKKLCWILSCNLDGEDVSAQVSGVDRYVDSDTQPEPPVEGLFYAPWYRVGEGKEPELEAARSSAVWPDATLEQLRDEQLLKDRLPALLEEFLEAVESLGLEW